jgi:eukaryotic-like serine/threonine-protein kinase
MQQNPLGRYSILRELGRGAIGRVYAARDASSGAAVALKVLEPALFSEPCSDLADLFLKNARSAARLRHRNIVKIHDAGEAGGTAYVAMELLEGESLRNILETRPLPLARAIQVFDDIASALAYAHEEGMVHRGVKPSNIIVLPSGVAKIGDFGTGQIGEAALRYKSPEQVRGDPVDHRSDLFSLGAVFYEMLTRRAPFAGGSAKEISENILRAKPPRPSEANPHVPAALDGIVLRMLAANPNERFANARILLRDLQRLQEALGLGPGASAGTEAPTTRLPPDDAVPTLRTPVARESRERELPQETKLSPRVQTVPVASQPAVKREPTLPDALPFRAIDEHDARFMRDRDFAPERRSGSRAPILATLALMVAALSIGVFYYSPDVLYYLTGLLESRAPATRMQEAPATAAAPTPTPAPVPVAAVVTHEPQKSPPKPLVAEPSPPVPTESLPVRASKQPATAESTPPQEAARAEKPVVAGPSPSARAAQPAASIPAPQPGGTAKLLLAVSPQGDLYIDGQHQGTTPPITTLDLEPGMHRIEIRSGSRKPYLTYVTLQAGDQRRIRHDFDAKPIRPPG